MPQHVYAVRVGRQPGLYDTWDECKAQVDSFSGAKYKKFKTVEEAQNFIDGVVDGTAAPAPTAPPRSPPSSVGTYSNSAGAPGNSSEFQRPVGYANRSAPYPPRNSGKDTFLAQTVTSGQANRKFSTLSSGKAVPSLAVAFGEASHLARKLGGLSQYSKLRQSVSAYSTAVERTSNTAAEYPSTQPGGKRNDSTDVAVVFTDGCCRNNGQSGAIAGIGVFWGNGSPHNISEPLPGRPTNNRAEIQAAVRAIRQAKEMGKSKIIIHTDSQFLINSITLWVPSWMSNNWKLGRGGQVVNRVDFETLMEVMDGIEVEWIHVRGHQGVWGNEEADRLANEGATMDLPEEPGMPVVTASGALVR